MVNHLRLLGTAAHLLDPSDERLIKNYQQSILGALGSGSNTVATKSIRKRLRMFSPFEALRIPKTRQNVNIVVLKIDENKGKT